MKPPLLLSRLPRLNALSRLLPSFLRTHPEVRADVGPDWTDEKWTTRFLDNVPPGVRLWLIDGIRELGLILSAERSEHFSPTRASLLPRSTLYPLLSKCLIATFAWRANLKWKAIAKAGIRIALSTQRLLRLNVSTLTYKTASRNSWSPTHTG